MCSIIIRAHIIIENFQFSYFKQGLFGNDNDIVYGGVRNTWKIKVFKIAKIIEKTKENRKTIFDFAKILGLGT